MQRCDAASVTGVPTEHRDDEFLVERDEEDSVDSAEDGNSAGGEDVGGADFPVHDGCLADEEGLERAEGEREGDGGCPNG